MIVEPLEGKAAQSVHVPPGCTMVMFDGSVRSSKTISSLMMWLRFLREGPQGALAIVGRTETSAINNVVMPLQEMLGTKRVVLNRGLGIVTIAGRECKLYGANDATAYTKIQGMTLAGAYVDEGAVIAQSFFNMLRSRLSVPGAMLYLTCNPEGPKHWLRTDWLAKAEWHLDRHGKLIHYQKWDDKGMALHLPIWRVTFLLDDNTYLARSNPAFVRDLKASWPKGSVFYRRYINSEWVSAEGTVYSMWDEERMTLQAAQLDRVDQVLMVGVDYGTTHRTRGYALGLVYVQRDPQGRPLWGVRGPDAVLVVLSEFAPETATVSEHAAQFASWLGKVQRRWGYPDWVAVDPAAATFRMELHARDLTTMKAHNAVVPGIQSVQSLMHGGHLFVIADECPYLVEMVEAYQWDTKATDAGRTAPIKADDDEVDALRYAVHTSRREWRDHIPLAHLDERDSEDISA